MSKHRGCNKRSGSKRPTTKMSSRKQARKNRRKMAERRKALKLFLKKNARQRFKEVHWYLYY